MKSRSLVVGGCIVVASMLASHAASASTDVIVSSNGVSTYSTSDTTLSDYYVIELEVPDGVTADNLLGAVLEFRVDVASRAVGDYTNESPLLEVHILNGELNSEIDGEDLRLPSSMRRNVNAGSDRLVRIDVTEAVLYYLANPDKNYGLVVGSLSNAREGFFTLKANTLPGNGVARVRFYY